MFWAMLAYSGVILALGIGALRREGKAPPRRLGRGWAIALITGGAIALMLTVGVQLFGSW